MTDAKRSIAKFSVDTHLFRELGELLVGRESTALIELVKNAYDADATEVTVFGENLGDPSRGVIRITDNGVGMTPNIFQRGFLRVAARIKNEGDRKSERWGRRFTGAKGVGRLSAHKLARKIQVQSIPWAVTEPIVGVDGFIDWDKVEQAETLDKIDNDAVIATERQVRKGEVHGTTLTLTRLRQKWTPAQRGRFLLEVEALRAPSVLTAPLSKNVIPETGLFDRPMFVDAKSTDPGFKLELEGDFQGGDNYWPAVVESAGWLLEIDVSPKRVRYLIVPTSRTRKEFPNARRMAFSEDHPKPESGPFFQARILIREGQATGKKDERTWASRIGGVRVYMEGFRVLPYGEDSDDWLALGRDTNDRTRKLRFLADSSAPGKLAEVDDEGLLLLPNKHYFGGVFLTANRAGSLQMLVNREGFVPDSSFELMVTLVRRGIDLSTRVRAAARAGAGNPAPSHSSGEGRSSHDDEVPERAGGDSLKGKAEGSLRRLAEQAVELEKLAADAPDTLKKRLMEAVIKIGHATAVSREIVPANSMVLVLASVGTQLAAFTHEVNRLLGLAGDLERMIARLREQDLPPKPKNHVLKVLVTAADLRRAIERQAAYLVDIVTPDARRRRSKQSLNDVLNATWKLVETSAEQRGISLHNEIDHELRSPPMFRAELMAVFTNLLTNAVKAAGSNGAIRASAEVSDNGEIHFRLENTGAAVDPSDGERWFRPFESTTVDVDPVLGQGMGLGLGITRDLLSEIGAFISFVQPHRGYATAIEIVFPGATS
ncbi:sensor histidine kinase [Stigmatella erecta]|uniref:histidine kinase n=1 Tax=Stigmatella erecta TaxID=83460 RepID=A0A1I0KKB1_9BACT|nr:ATP-binding protein [Stigmatella erecta]SEU24623.1 Signal transduction histidine kinase [Stigmatella erecta]